MNERTFRLFQGSIILLGLVLESDSLIYFFIGISLFEGLTGFRIPVMVSKLKHQYAHGEQVSQTDVQARIAFDAERVMRLTVALLLAISYIFYPDVTWFFPWFMGAMLVLAGITNVCPMVIYFRWLGFR